MENREMSFEECMKQLELCAEKIKNADTTLEESIRAYEEGQKYYLKCSEILNNAKGKVQLYRKED